jgi:hypothetical protein
VGSASECTGGGLGSASATRGSHASQELSSSKLSLWRGRFYWLLVWAKWWFVGFGHLLVRGVGVHKHQVLYLFIGYWLLSIGYWLAIVDVERQY